VVADDVESIIEKVSPRVGSGKDASLSRDRAAARDHGEGDAHGTGSSPHRRWACKRGLSR
jgi:hypothetical protein